jgi:glyoxylase-like metal-dependent hydrolase (beta-lactamase superfamily II)
MATIDVLFDGYTSGGVDGDRVASTVSLARNEEAIVVIDPGLVPSPASILDPLAALGVAPEAVTDVVLSHHHPDHTLNAALFPAARFHDHWAIYRGDEWISRDAEGFQIATDVTLIETPGHSAQDITTLVRTDEGIVAFTHLWWRPDGPADDPYSPDPAELHRGRARVLEVAATIVPGHGPRFVPGPSTPR